jgi:TetR/AcrR family transcriptional regulator
MAIAERRTRERNQRRNEIINAAEKLYFANDYDKVTMDEIAKEAEVNKALLYYYFQNKEALFFAVHHRISKDLHDLHLKCSLLDTDGLSKLKAMGQSVYEFAIKYPDHFRLYSYARSERFADTDNEDAKKSIELFSEMWKYEVEAFDQGKEEGLIRNDLDSVEMSIYLSLISMGALNLEPAIKSVLKSQGINEDKLWEDMGSFIRPALTDRSSAELEELKSNKP